MTDQVTTIRENYQRVLAQIAQAAARGRRRAQDVRLLVVTKAQPVNKMLAAYEAGVRLFGENYPEETGAKIAAMRGLEGVEWHMIGHLQSRKTRIVAASFDYLHSLDSLALAQRLSRLLQEMGRSLPVLLEVNVSGEESKGGWPAWDETGWERLRAEVEQLADLPHLNIRGLMTMPPLFTEPELSRPYFRRVRHLREWLAQRCPRVEWAELSMGTSADFGVAVEEGATFVRVGTAIVGPRPPRVSVEEL